MRVHEQLLQLHIPWQHFLEKFLEVSFDIVPLPRNTCPFMVEDRRPGSHTYLVSVNFTNAPFVKCYTGTGTSCILVTIIKN